MSADEDLRSILRMMLRNAVRSYFREQKPIGGAYGYEWPASGRIAIHMARSEWALRWEKRGITVDLEYGQRGKHGDPKLNLDTGRRVRPDIIIHRRGCDEINWLVCEVKLHSGKQPRRHAHDLDKLIRYRQQYGYRLAIWLSLPKSINPGAQAFIREVVSDESGRDRPGDVHPF